MTDFQEIKALAIARTEEAAMYHWLWVEYFQQGTWITFTAWHRQNALDEPFKDIPFVVQVKARGWKNASDAFVKAITVWAQKDAAKSKQALKDALDEARLVGEAVDVDPDNWSTNY